MKEEKTKSKKRLIYYIVLAVSVLLLIAATVLTVYFVTDGGSSVLEVPPQGDITPGGDDPSGNQPGADDPSGNQPGADDPSGNQPGGEDPTGPSDPVGGETARFIAPIENASYNMEYAAIYANQVLRWYYRHKAIDFVADEGAAVRAMSDGVVEDICERAETGKYVVVDHGEGIKSIYRFIEIKEGLKVGDTVKQGDTVGTVAAAYGIEKADGPHLHLEMQENGKNVNPLDYIDVVFEEK